MNLRMIRQYRKHTLDLGICLRWPLSHRPC